MATSPSDPGADPLPPEVLAIAVALAAAMFEPRTEEASPPAAADQVGRWRWQGWD